MTKRAKELFKRHDLVTDKARTCTDGGINQGKESWLFRCKRDCNWLGWISIEDATEEEEGHAVSN